jgi:hypothetical protein
LLGAGAVHHIISRLAHRSKQHLYSITSPRFWSITARVPQYPHDRGYAARREQAMADFQNTWTI